MTVPSQQLIEVFRRPFKVMFQHCDPAGIVFYPRYFEMISATVEDWFEELGCSFSVMHTERDFGIPTAQIAARFLRPSRLGDVLDARLSLARLGRTAMDLRLAAHGPEGPRVEADLTIVSVAGSTLRPIPWPDDVRARIETLGGAA